MGVPGTDLDGLRELRGRGGRREYWLWMAVIVVLAVRIAFMPGFGLLGLLISLALIGMLARRLHDLGVSGWWILGLIVGQVAVTGAASTFVDPVRAGSIASLFTVAVLVILGVIPGQAAANRFGPPRNSPPSPTRS